MNNKGVVVILGCGHSESLHHYNANGIVKTPNGNMLIDCGYTVKHALHRQGMGFENIDGIFISHVHGDHVFGLERVAFETKFKLNKKIKLFLHKSIEKELWDQTLKGSLGYNSDGESSITDYFDVKFVESNTFKFCGVNYSTFPVKHTKDKPTYGLLIQNQILWSSDTVSIPATIKQYDFLQGIHDVTLTDYNPVHASLTALIEEYPLAVRKKLYLISYEDNWQEFKSIVDSEFAGFATQGQELEFKL
ncbi:MAG: metal-dependent hydrolase [Kangiellaceae bacterium]|nr:metal-dependent hydrolase [Kangiellaceae bacterium]|tara:strand:+ start:9489 stop:10232 length:744 start_codon:yes stop_codon:yes gene_type:complete